MAGTGTPGFSGDGGPATSAQLSEPSGLALDGSGNLFIADHDNNRIRKVDLATGMITTVAGTGTPGFSGDGGPATSAQLHSPSGITLELNGTLLFADTANHRVRKVDPSGIITTVAGTGTLGFSGDGGPATSAQFHNPTDVIVDMTGNLFISDQENHRVRMVLVDCSTEIAALSGQLGQLQSQVAALTQQNSTLQSQLAQVTQQYQALTAVLAAGLGDVQRDIEQVMKDPQFQIPGATLTEEFQNLIVGILGLNKGRLEGLFKALGGR